MIFNGKNETSRGARMGGWKLLGTAALTALCLSAAACAADAPADGSSFPAPAATTPAPSASAPSVPAPSASAPVVSMPAPAPFVAPAEGPSGSLPHYVAPAPNPSGSGETVSVAIDNSVGGIVALSDGTQLTIPAGALPDGVGAITITSSPTAAPGEYASISPMYVFGPDGTVFSTPVTITFPFTIALDAATTDITVLWSRSSLDADGFDMLPTTVSSVTGTQYLATASVHHFSRGFCGKKFGTDPHPVKDPYQD